MRRIAVLVVVLAIGAPLTACGSSRPRSAKAVGASIVAAPLAQRSVHWSKEFEVPMIAADRTVADVTMDSGTQRTAYLSRTNRYDDVVHIRLANHTVYLRGDAASLLQTTNVTPAQARRYAGQWISIPKGDKFYAELADGLTLGSIVHSVALTRGRWRLRAHSSGSTVLVGPTGMSLAAHASGEPLPVEFDQGWDFSSDTVRFSKWNEPVHVVAPAGAVPIATVRRG